MARHTNDTTKRREIIMTQNALIALKERIIETSTVAFEAIELAMAEHDTAIEAVTDELATADREVANLTEALRIAEGRISSLMNELATVPQAVASPRVPTPTPIEVSMNFTRQPELPATLPIVRFFSKSSAMGGLANIKAQMSDLRINAKRMRLEGSTYVPTAETLVINWGGGFELPTTMNGFSGRHLNNLDAVKLAASKLKTFQKLHEDSELVNHIPAFNTMASQAIWNVVYCRADLYGHSGAGITVVRDGGSLPNTPLYVEGLNVKHEYRVHTVNGFTKIQKKARLGTENPNMDVRNLDGGWTFINEFTLADRGRSELHALSLKTLACLGLDFGAVDIVRTEENTWKILEVNTAPGVTAESNIEWYTKALIATV